MHVDIPSVKGLVMLLVIDEELGRYVEKSNCRYADL